MNEFKNVFEFPTNDVRTRACIETEIRRKLVEGGATQDLIAFVIERLQEDLADLDFNHNIATNEAELQAVLAMREHLTDQMCHLIQRLAIAHLRAGEAS